MSRTNPPSYTWPMTLDTALQPADFDELDALLDDLRSRHDETPQWEFCEGVMAALICTRRPVPPEEYLPVLLASDEAVGADPSSNIFADADQRERFMTLWNRRWQEVVTALDTDVETLDDDRAYQPEVLDVRGGMAALPEHERVVLDDEPLPSFAQVWALGFMYVVENWPDDWATPRDKDAAEWLDGALGAIVAMTEDDTGVPSVSMFSEDGPPASATRGWKPTAPHCGRCTTCATSGAPSAPSRKPCAKRPRPAATIRARVAVGRSTRSATALERL